MSGMDLEIFLPSTFIVPRGRDTHYMHPHACLRSRAEQAERFRESVGGKSNATSTTVVEGPLSRSGGVRKRKKLEDMWSCGGGLAAALLVYMPAGRESERAELFVFV